MEGPIARSRTASRGLKEMIAKVGEALLGVLERIAAVAKAHSCRALCGVEQSVYSSLRFDLFRIRPRVQQISAVMRSPQVDPQCDFSSKGASDFISSLSYPETVCQLFSHLKW